MPVYRITYERSFDAKQNNRIDFQETEMRRKSKLLSALAALALATTGAVAQQGTPADVPRYAHKVMSYEWYQEQMKLWRAEIDRNPGNATAWFNYYKASRYSGFSAPERAPDHYERLGQLVDDMEKAIPQTFEYNYVRWWNGGNDERYFPNLQRAYELRPDYELLSEDFVTYYEMHGDREKMAEFCRKWYQAEALPRTVLNYQYNVLMSLEKNAVLVTAGDMDTYPVWMLQYVKNIRPDVTMLNTSLMTAPEYRKRMMSQLGLKGNAEADSEPAFWKSVVENTSSRPIYFALTVYPELVEPFKENLYTVGLANRYSPGRIDNIALLKRNWERFRLDYLTMDFYDEKYPFNNGYLQMLNMNYVMPAALLYEHYTLSGEGEKAGWFRDLALRMARQGEQEKEVLEYLNGLAGGEADQKADRDRDQPAGVESKEESAFGGAIKIFPNPSYSDLTVQLPEALEAEVRLADTKGNLVRTVNARGPEIRIDINGLSSGTYLLNIRTSKGTFTRNVQVVR